MRESEGTGCENVITCSSYEKSPLANPTTRIQESSAGSITGWISSYTSTGKNIMCLNILIIRRFP